MYKAVIFDLDGTLLDTLEDLADSMNAVLRSLDHPVHGVDVYKAFVGEGVEFLVSSALPPQKRNFQTINECVQKMRLEYEKRWNAKTKPYDGIPSLLDELIRSNIRLAVLSNKPHEFSVKMMDHFLSSWKFYPVYGAKDGVAKKPDPSVALQIAQTLKVETSECLYLGDTRIDMQTANAAGMYAVGALWGFRSRDELVSSGARALISHPMVLLDLI